MGDVSVSRKETIRLRQMEMSLVRARLAQPTAIAEADYQCLRYLLNFAGLDVFAPGAALGEGGWEDVRVDASIVQSLRELVLRALYRPLRRGGDRRQRLTESVSVLPPLRTALLKAHGQLLARHKDDFSAAELEAEICRKTLVLAAGGGGGAGYVYIGALARLLDVGHGPGYLVGTSIGALLGGFFARDAEPDAAGLLAWAKTLRVHDIFATLKLAPTYSLPGLLRLHLQGFEEQFRYPDGSPMRLSDAAIPYETVIGGLRRSMYERIPAPLRRLEAPERRKRRFSVQVAERMVQLTLYATPQLVKGIPLGRDPATRDIRMLDAIGISAAIPGVLQYEPPDRDEISDASLQALKREHELAALMDGGVVDNVPARTAWEGVQGGRIGTRNAFYLAFDCFHPQFDPRHAWLWPVTGVVQMQLPANRPYHDWLLRFEPTLSPINLLPDEADFDRSWAWGQAQMDAILPFVEAAMAPIQYRPGQE